MRTIYFQPPNINPKYCEIGMISETEPDYIWYLEEPCKILISDVLIIPKENVYRDKKNGLYCVANQIEVIEPEIVTFKNE
jgi:hypothetical protein